VLEPDPRTPPSRLEGCRMIHGGHGLMVTLRVQGCRRSPVARVKHCVVGVAGRVVEE
jgi:hypothetical protein